MSAATVTMTPEAVRVAAGAAFLDTREPGWWKDIDLSRLDLSSPCRCVLGQLHTGTESELGDPWGEICDDFGIAPWAEASERPSDYSLGFNAVKCGTDCYGETPPQADYDALTGEWVRLIRERRAS